MVGGEPGLVASYRTMAERLGVAEKVAFVGRTDDVRPFLWSADAFISPSHYEAFSAALLEASADLGARDGTTLRRVVLPAVFPAIVAGSIFTFSLTLGDYIAVKIVGGANQMLGNVVYDNVGAANNLPFAAAVATVPVVVMLVYLAAVRRTGALDNL